MSTLTCGDLAQRIRDLLNAADYRVPSSTEDFDLNVVDRMWAYDPTSAEVYVQRRLEFSLGRLRVRHAPGDPKADALVALDTYARLQQLQGGTE